MDNEKLKGTYEEMHKKGVSAWFDDGSEERELIMEMGMPWAGETVLEIGCGEGDLCGRMAANGAQVVGVDYSETAIEKAKRKFPEIEFSCRKYTEIEGRGNRIVMQGVLEHMDDPWAALDWMLKNLLEAGGDIITTSPGFINPRGFVWMTLDMLGAVMSKTDLHFLHPWEFEAFCRERKYKLEQRSCSIDWAAGGKMIKDLSQRVPLALHDGRIALKKKKLDDFMTWLELAGHAAPLRGTDGGAVIGYRIMTGN